MPDLFDPQQLQTWLHTLGTWAWPVFIGLQIAQVVVFWIPGEVVQIAGGMVFGVWEGTALSLLGIAAGSLTAFLLARYLGKARMEKWLANQGFHRFQAVIHHPRLDLILGGVFLLPFLPKDIFCYLAGLSDVKPWRFFWVTTLARVPSLLLSSWVGDLAVHGLGMLFLGVVLVSTVVGLVLFAYRKSLLSLLVR
jgi:uncharacterized membrane protein YdjX (TVP38/TMEM64 family)